MSKIEKAYILLAGLTARRGGPDQNVAVRFNGARLIQLGCRTSDCEVVGVKSSKKLVGLNALGSEEIAKRFLGDRAIDPLVAVPCFKIDPAFVEIIGRLASNGESHA